ncbi:MAG: SRPBCC family protein [Gammaproteobacteria bacterium]
MLRILLVFLIATPLCLAGPPQFGVTDSHGWSLVRIVHGFPIYHKDIADSRFPQTRTGAMIAAPPAKVHAVISDYDHFVDFVPYVRDSRTVTRTFDKHLVFQRLHFPGPLADRRYIIRITDRVNQAGRDSYRVEWKLEPKQDVVDDLSGLVPKYFSGFWELIPAEQGTATNAIYSIHVDPGGFWPAWLITPAVDHYLPQVMQAVIERSLIDASQ